MNKETVNKINKILMELDVDIRCWRGEDDKQDLNQLLLLKEQLYNASSLINTAYINELYQVRKEKGLL